MLDLTKLYNSFKYVPSWYEWSIGTTSEWIVKELSKLGIIAGGSILACYDGGNEECSTINDIDIYVNKKEQVMSIYNFLKKYFRVKKIKHLKSIIELELEGTPNIQIIMFGEEYLKPKNIIESFDLDYCRCAYYQDEIYTTLEFDLSLEMKHIINYNLDVSPQRLLKAQKKGYKLPEILEKILELKFKPTQLPVYEIITESQLENLEIEKFQNLNYNKDDEFSLKVVSLCKRDMKWCELKLFHYSIQVINSEDKCLKTFYTIPITFKFIMKPLKMSVVVVKVAIKMTPILKMIEEHSGQKFHDHIFLKNVDNLEELSKKINLKKEYHGRCLVYSQKYNEWSPQMKSQFNFLKFPEYRDDFKLRVAISPYQIYNL